MTDDPATSDRTNKPPQRRQIGVPRPERPDTDQAPAQRDRPSTGPDPSSRSSDAPNVDVDVAGFTADPEPVPPDSAPANDVGTPPQRRKTTVVLPYRLVTAVRETAEQQDCILAEVIISAYAEEIQDLPDRLADTEAANRRKDLGLPPPPPPRPPSVTAGEQRGHLPIWISTDALQVLDEAADRFGISRSHLVEELLERYLNGGSPRSHSGTSTRHQGSRPGPRRRS